MNEHHSEELNRERSEVLAQLEDWLEWPMILLGFAWLAMLMVELSWGLSPVMEICARVIWVVFVLEFALKLTLAPGKLAFLRSHWLTGIALLIPAVRVFRIVRAMRAMRVARVARGLRLVRLLTSLNRGMKALGLSMARRGLAYVIALTTIVTLTGAAGMYAFEREVAGGFDSYGVALWWTAMLLTSIGSEYWPKTAEGRVLCLLLSVYGFAVFGYMTASLASFFIERDAEDERAEIASARMISEVRDQVQRIRDDMQALLQRER